jgi:hypothetical protein
MQAADQCAVGDWTSDEEVGKLMLDREAWTSRISMIVKENTFSNCGRCRSGSEIVFWQC